MKRTDVVEQAQAIRNSMNKVTETLTDAEAAVVSELFLTWKYPVQYYDGTDGEHPQSRVRGITSGFLYKRVKSHTSQADWPPERTPALWVVFNTSSPGTIDDPIPAARGMEYEYGKYYLDPEDGKTYLCKRGEETGSIVLYYLPHEIIGQYFEEVT